MTDNPRITPPSHSLPISVLINRDTRIVVQGITGKAGAFHARQCIDYAPTVVAGVTPGKGGRRFDDEIPIFDSVHEAVEREEVNSSLIFVPPPYAADSILEAIDAGIQLIVCITEGIPVRDMLWVKGKLRDSEATLIGPNCPGIITPGKCKMGIMPGYIHRPGKVGVVSRSGTLTYEAVWQLTSRGHGQSTCIGIGGDPILGTSHCDAVRMFNEDPDTEAIVMIGEIGGSAEEEAAAYVEEHVEKPVTAYIAGLTAPPGRRMGHAGAIVSDSGDGAKAKIAALRRANIAVAETPSAIADSLLSIYPG